MANADAKRKPKVDSNVPVENNFTECLNNVEVSKEPLTLEMIKSAVDDLLKDKFDEIDSRIATLDSDLKKSGTLLTNCSRDVRETKTEMEQFKTGFPNQVGLLLANSESMKDLQKKCDSLSAELSARISELNEKKTELTNKETELSEIKSQLTQNDKDRKDMIEWIAKILGTKNVVDSVENVKNMLDDVRKIISQQQIEINGLKNTIQDNKRTISSKDDEIRNEKNNLKKCEEEYSRKIQETQDEFDKKSAEAEENLRATEMRISAKLKEKENFCENLEKQISELNQSLKNLDEDLKKARKENDDKLNLIRKREGELAYEKDKNESLSSSLTKSNSMNSEFESAMKPYMEILDAMRMCDSMRSAIVDTLGLPESGELSIDNQIKYVNKFADKFSFARIVYDSMKSYKESRIEALTENELSAIKVLNTFYRQRFSIKFDALDCNVSAGSAFDRKKMKLISDPSNTDVIDVSFLCVPALYMMNGKDLEQKALVQGA